MKTMNDVNEMRLEAAACYGDLTRQSERWQADGDVAAGIAMFTNDILHTGAVVQYAHDLEAWVTLRERVMALMGHRDPSSTAMAALHDVIDIMDELEES